MTGVLSMVIAPAIERMTITLRDAGGGLIDCGGAISISMRGATQLYIGYSSTSSHDIVLQMQTNLAQSWFKRLTIEDGAANTFQTFTSASAAYSNVGGGTVQWVWNTGALWAASDANETKRLIFQH
jgi:hypothetical protein